jgi:hypothetical protein
MKIEYVKISEVRDNIHNPRVIKDKDFKKLVKSIQEFPKMLELRPIIVDEDMVVLGGNQRLKACIEAKMTEIPIIRANELTKEEQKAFIVKDNAHFGSWDFDMLSNDFDFDFLVENNIDIAKVLDTEEIDLFEEQFNSKQQDLEENEEEKENEQFSHFIIICHSEKEDDAIREQFNLGVKTKSSRGKYESNVIDAEKIVSLFN